VSTEADPRDPGVSSSSAPADLQDVGKLIDAQNQALVAALRRGDSEAVARFYTTDTELVVPLSAVVRGRPAVQELYGHLLRAGFTLLEQSVVERYPVGPMICEVRTSRIRHHPSVAVQSSREMTLWRQEDGEWRIHREVSRPLGP
jgi:ketosteroid isomerase-like protein